MRQLLDSLQMLASDQPAEDKAAARISVRMPCPRRGKLPHTAQTGRLRRRVDRTSRRALTRDRCAAAGRGAGRCFPGIKPHRPAPRSVPRCSNGDLLGRHTRTLRAGQCRGYHALEQVCENCVMRYSESAPISAPAATRWGQASAWWGGRSAGAQQRRPRTPGIARLPPASGLAVRIPPCSGAQPQRTGGPLRPVCLRRSRPRTRLSVTIRKLGVVLLSIPPDFVRRTPPVARHHPPMPGHTHAERETHREAPLSPAARGVVNWESDTSPTTGRD